MALVPEVSPVIVNIAAEPTLCCKPLSIAGQQAVSFQKCTWTKGVVSWSRSTHLA